MGQATPSPHPSRVILNPGKAGWHGGRGEGGAVESNSPHWPNTDHTMDA